MTKPPGVATIPIKNTVRRGTEGPIPEREYSRPKTPNFHAMPPIRQTDYAKHAGLSKGHVSNLVRAGMPLTSLEAADQWRGLTSRRSLRRSRIALKAPPRVPVATTGTRSSAEAVEAAWGRLEETELVAYRLMTAALENGQPDSARLLAIHASAVNHLSEGRQRILDLAERERTLVSSDWVRKVMVEHDGAVASLIRSMPRLLAGRVAPHDPEHAERELDRWAQETCLRTLFETNPWKT